MPRVIILIAVGGLAFHTAGCSGSGQPLSSNEAGRPAHGDITDGAGQSRSPDAAIGRRWQWTRTVAPVEHIVVEQPQRYTLLLNEDGRAEIQFDCNQGGGSYQIGDGKLSFGPLISTRMACPSDSQDAVYMAQLGRVTSFFVEDGVLFLEMPMDSGTMRFERVGGSK
jgi:heat shock protein HslJ